MIILLNYSDNQIKIKLESILETKNFTIKPVGNHHLKRNLVYQIDLSNDYKYIFKLYSRYETRSKELSSLKLLESTDVKCPKIFKYGNFEDGSHWLITEYINGVLFDKVINHIEYNNLLTLFNEIGEELGKIHALKTFDFFGDWDEAGQSISNTKNYYSHFVKNMESCFKEVLNHNLPHKNLLIDAIDTIRNNYQKLNINISARLVHSDFDGRNILVQQCNGLYTLSGIIDFEASYPNNPEENLTRLYYRYFINNIDYETAFLNGYKNHMNFDVNFKERLHIYLLCFVVSNCCWAYKYAPDYYNDIIEFLRSIFKFNHKTFHKN